jgi:hypothetical protein
LRSSGERVQSANLKPAIRFFLDQCDDFHAKLTKQIAVYFIKLFQVLRDFGG